MDNINIALYMFRNLVYCLYREIRALREYNHERIYSKIKHSSFFYDKLAGKNQADQLYKQTECFDKINDILQPYKDKTGLTIYDLCQAFKEGNWKNSHGDINYGGPKWGEIADATLELKNLICNQKCEGINAMIPKICALRHNTGKVVDKFHDRDILKLICP